MGKLTEDGITIVATAAYKVGGRRYFTRNAAQRALAKSCAKQALERQGFCRGFGRANDGSPKFEWSDSDETRYWRAIAYLCRIYRRFGTPLAVNGNAIRRAGRAALEGET